MVYRMQTKLQHKHMQLQLMPLQDSTARVLLLVIQWWLSMAPNGRLQASFVCLIEMMWPSLQSYAKLCNLIISAHVDKMSKRAPGSEGQRHVYDALQKELAHCCTNALTS